MCGLCPSLDVVVSRPSLYSGCMFVYGYKAFHEMRWDYYDWR
jgi:hypothetical protein